MADDKNPWDGDLLGVQELGETFTKLVQSIDEAKVISIEAGFGRGKTFFRTRWAKHLREAGEVVVEIDARQSDHSSDPVVTFIGALVGALGTDEETRLAKAKKAGLKYGGLLGRTVVRAAVGKAADELFDVVGGKMEAAEANDLLRAAVDGFGDGMSKFAAETIAAQLKAEEARTKEMPEQLDALRKALTFRKKSKRVVILIDELDRCHPDYAIGLLEAMKLVFDRPGYVFVLMVNSDHLERIAAHRFVGWHKDDEDTAREPYLDKFVDMRLKLAAGEEKIGEAARAFALELPEPEIPFGEGPEFTVERAAQVAADLAPISGLSMRQIKRVLLRVELAVRCHDKTEVDLPLLVWLAFQAASAEEVTAFYGSLPRSKLTTDKNSEWKNPDPDGSMQHRRNTFEKNKYEQQEFIRENCQELVVPAENLHRLEVLENGRQWETYHRVLVGLGAWYIPEHQAMLDQVHNLVAD